MQIHTSSAHTLGQCESFKHLSPQAKEALLSLKKIKNFGFEQPDDLANVKAITTNNHDNPSALTESIVDQVVRHPSQNEFMGSQNFSFIYNSKSLLAFKNSVVLDDPTPDFSDALSSEREHINETLQNQQLIQKQLKLFSNLQVKQPKDRIQENKGFIKKFTQEKENMLNQNTKKNYQLNRLSDLISKEIKKNILTPTSNNVRKTSYTSLNTQHSSQTKFSLQTQQDYLFKKAICLQEKQKTFIDQGQLINTTKEMKECTFNPKINQKSKVAHSSSFFERQSTWMRKKNDKITQQVEIQKEKATKECTFSPNLRDTSNNRIDSCDVYYRNLQWEKKFNKKKQHFRNSMMDLHKNDLQNSTSKLQLQRSNSTQIINQQTDMKQLLEIQLKVDDAPKYLKCLTPTYQTTGTITTPNSQSGYLDLGKRKNSIEQIEQKYKLLYDLVNYGNKNTSKKKK
ncbi:unnamed protein product (macronuclear) [Paramecium tetraurelia]|uniref:Uncharacterized protein n=1 Tax=Paramecium tetraurelia TaxID=5888 RepID=A0CNT3_PARTE|nr:uncharacterized protein GSPATT00008892001 [Paramecium tetraurelia]CAK72450.1 unnamed protein product [Paramecium tetraurelia]|eukprot:XP_001439847.1 hypothetical protein (macronuclear) [Paramecium tetraurelia strain d4-2]